MTISTLDAAVTINGDSVNPYLEKYERVARLSEAGETFTLYLSADAPKTFKPWMEVQVSEQSTPVLIGYISQVRMTRPDNKVIVSGMDFFKRAKDWFIDDHLYANGETAAYWVDYLCTLCALDYLISDPSGSSNAVGGTGEMGKVEMGLKSVAEALTYVCQRAAWVMRVTASGVIEFISAVAKIGIDRTITDDLGHEIIANDDNTRTEVKVFGAGDIFFKASRSVANIGTRTMVFGDPSIDTLEKAEALANGALNQYASINTVANYRIIGNPLFRVGDRIDSVVANAIATDTLTDVSAQMGREGYEMGLTLGRRSWRYPIFPITSGSPAGSGPPDLSDPDYLLAYWKLDEAAGSTTWVSEVHADIPDTTLIGSITTQSAGGKIGTAYARNGTGQQGGIGKGATTYYSLDGDFTVAGWVYFNTESVAAQQVFIVYGQPGAVLAIPQWEILRGSNLKITFAYGITSGGTNGRVTSTNTMSYDGWHFFVASRNSVTGLLRLRMDNGAADELSWFPGPSDGGYVNPTLIIGSDILASFTGNFFKLNGRVDEVGIWTRILTPDEESYLYNSGVGKTYPFT